MISFCHWCQLKIRVDSPSLKFATIKQLYQNCAKKKRSFSRTSSETRSHTPSTPRAVIFSADVVRGRRDPPIRRGMLSDLDRTLWGGNLYKRFCIMFSESSTGCWASKGNLQKTNNKTYSTNCRPRLYLILIHVPALVITNGSGSASDIWLYALRSFGALILSILSSTCLLRVTLYTLH